jgi:hypothetical protein
VKGERCTRVSKREALIATIIGACRRRLLNHSIADERILILLASSRVCRMGKQEDEDAGVHCNDRAEVESCLLLYLQVH